MLAQPPRHRRDHRLASAVGPRRGADRDDGARLRREVVRATRGRPPPWCAGRCQLAVGGLQVAVDDRGVGEHVGLVGDGEAGQQVVPGPLVLGALQLALADRLLAQPIELGGQRLDGGLGRLPGLHDRGGEEQVGVLDDVAAAEGGQRQPLLVDQRAVDARAVPVGQHLVDDVQRIAVRVPVVGDRVGDDHRRQRHVVVTVRRRSAVCAAPSGCRAHPPSGPWYAAEVALHQRHRLGRVEVAGDHQHGVLRHE